MTGKIFKKYLLWFDGQIAGRQVLSLIDGFSTRHAGLNLFHEEHPQDLTNTKVYFLPTNATSVYGPLDQEIIKAWKANYRRNGFIFFVQSMARTKTLEDNQCSESNLLEY